MRENTLVTPMNHRGKRDDHLAEQYQGFLKKCVRELEEHEWVWIDCFEGSEFPYSCNLKEHNYDPLNEEPRLDSTESLLMRIVADNSFLCPTFFDIPLKTSTYLDKPFLHTNRGNLEKKRIE